MKKTFALIATAILCYFFQPANAQLQKGNLLIGANVMNVNAGVSSPSYFSMDLTPKVGYFIEDNIVIGASVGLHYLTTEGIGHTFRYDISVFGRYYFSPAEVTSLLEHGRFFGEANVGVGADNHADSGFAFSLGPGYSYFITPNIGIEALLKLNGIIGTSPSVGIGFGLGFQIYLAARKVAQKVDTGQ